MREKLDLLDEDNGTVSVTSVSSKNKTIASVVKQCQVNVDLYEISAPKVRKWDVPIKQKDADGATHLEIVECYYIGFTLVPKSSIRIIAPIVARVKAQAFLSGTSARYQQFRTRDTSNSHPCRPANRISEEPHY